LHASSVTDSQEKLLSLSVKRLIINFVVISTIVNIVAKDVIPGFALRVSYAPINPIDWPGWYTWRGFWVGLRCGAPLLRPIIAYNPTLNVLMNSIVVLAKTVAASRLQSAPLLKP
jgi:hypothetical protein